MAVTVWHRGIRMTAEVMSLSVAERRAITEAQASSSQHVLMGIKHMAERHVPVAGADHIWLFFLPDFTNLFRDWYAAYIEHIFAVYGPDAQAELAVGGAYLTLKYVGERPRDKLSRLLGEGEYGAVRALLEGAQRARVEAERALVRFEDRLRGRGADTSIAELVRVVSRFAAYALDNVFPEELFARRFPHVPLHAAYFTPISSWQLLFERALGALEAVYVGEMTWDVAVEQYARESSYLRWGDIESHEDDLRFTAEFLGNLGRQFPTYLTVWEHRTAARDRRRITGDPRLAHAREVREWRVAVRPEDYELFDILIAFAAEGQEYNEHRRIIFTRTLRLLREYCIRHGYDWRTVRLETLETRDQKAAIAAA